MKENNETNEKKEKAFDGGETSKSGKKGDAKGKKKHMNSEKKFYLFTAISCAAVLLAIIIVAAVVSNSGASQQAGKLPPVNSSASSDVGDNGEQSGNNGDNSGNSGNNGDKPVVTLPEGMIAPVETVTVGNEHGFHHNQTLGWYYVHEGVDFTAAVGTEVLAAEDGVVESVCKDDLLFGTEVVLSHANGLKTLYRFVADVDGLTVGQEVKKGDVIATVGEPTGNEYKDGAHLHFEVFENGKSVDPTKFLTLEEK